MSQENMNTQSNETLQVRVDSIENELTQIKDKDLEEIKKDQKELREDQKELKEDNRETKEILTKSITSLERNLTQLTELQKHHTYRADKHEENLKEEQSKNEERDKQMNKVRREVSDIKHDIKTNEKINQANSKKKILDLSDPNVKIFWVLVAIIVVLAGFSLGGLDFATISKILF